MFWMFTNSEETGGAIYVSINGNLNINIQESIHIYKCNFDGMAANKGGAIYISSTESSRLFNVEECTVGVQLLIGIQLMVEQFTLKQILSLL